jgi:peptide deformylase
MVASMHAAGGVGLAANQIGVDARIFVIDCPDLDTGARTVGHVVNPVLALPGPRELLVREEACLALPGAHAQLARAATAVVTGFDVHGQPLRITGHNLVARCLQHEVDHLDGMLYVDRLPTALRRSILAATDTVRDTESAT